MFDNRHDFRNKAEKSPSMTSKDKTRMGFEAHPKMKDIGRAFSSESAAVVGSPNRELKNKTSWETLVLFALNFKKLNVHMNMGNVMGNVT